MRHKAARALGNAICNNWKMVGPYTDNCRSGLAVSYSREILIELKKQGFRLIKVKIQN